MNLTSVVTLLNELAASTSSARVEVGKRGDPPHDHAYLKLTSPTSPETYAVISTPGDRWFELEVAGGYGTVEISELTSDREVTEILRRFVRGGTAYLDGRWTIRRSKLIRARYVALESEEGVVKLRLSFKGSLKRILSP